MATHAHELTLLQLNDTHAYFAPHQEVFWTGSGATYRPAGGYARIATLARQIREERPGRVLFCDGGDALHGTAPAVRTQGRAVVPILNALGLAATTAHWEFAYGPHVLRERVGELAYPLLACNVYDEQTGQQAYPSHTIVEVSGLRIGIIGIASNIVDKTMPPAFSAGLRFTLGREEVPPLIARLRRDDRVDLVVLLSHLGFPQDMRLLAEVRGVDVCLSAHTHNRLYRPARVGETIVIQSGCHGSFLGRLDLSIARGKIVDYRHELLTVGAELVPDPVVDELVGAALAPYAAELAEVVGETGTALARATGLEATMDNLLLQALRAHTGTQLAFSNGWRYGAPVPPGPITLNDLYNIVPMDPPVSTVDLTGEELVAMLEENLERTFAPDPYGQMGGYVKRCLGLRASVKLENPAGARIQQLFVGDEEVRPGRLYGAAFVTEQGVPSKYGHHHGAQPVHAVAALRAHVRRQRPVRAELLGTFTLV